MSIANYALFFAGITSKPDHKVLFCYGKRTVIQAQEVPEFYRDLIDKS